MKLYFYYARFYLGSFLGRIRQRSTIRTRHGFTMRANTRELIGRYLFTFGTWEPNLTRFVTDRVGPETRFIDVGANLGYFSLLAASRGATVTGIEASPEMARQAQENLDRAGYSIPVINAAAASEEGEVVLYEPIFHTNAGMRTTVPNGQPIHARVRGAPLGKLVEFDEEADTFLKIDIEGAEKPVLLELLERVRANPRARLTIVVELSHKNTDLLQEFRAAGCRISFLPNDYSLATYANRDGTCQPVDFDSPRPPEPYETIIETGG